MAISAQIKTNAIQVSKNFKYFQSRLSRAIDQGVKQAGFQLLDIIRTKTQKGIDYNDRRFAPYSPGYLKQLQREGKSTKVNLDQFKRAGVYLFLGRFLLPALAKFRPETEKDRFERMAEYYMSQYNVEFQKILEDGVEYDSSGDGTISTAERENLHGYNRLQR